MQKILTICVPSYNMQDYLHKCVDSILAAHVDDDLEIIIVNDGSKDHTIDIANEYKEKYPDTVVVIDKENGQYGSCVNAALRIARGKYFRIVDADDWVDSAALASFVNTLRNVDADCFVTRFVTHDRMTRQTKVNKLDVPAWNTLLKVSDIKIDNRLTYMHQLTWRQALLHDMNYSQTEGIYYTDSEYAFLPFANAASIYFCDLNVYQYQFGREGQSMGMEMHKMISHKQKLYERAKTYLSPTDSPHARAIKNSQMFYHLQFLLSSHILYDYNNKPMDDFLRNELAQLFNQDMSYSDICPDARMLHKYIQMWYEPTLFNNICLAVRRLWAR